eukprot:TRINITY_DN54385_c0_g1_i1.p1 TRINITY_DN54385_c0_g1~~TRINITY_DN54385_c0_g1_i1.p1  ORF type:complete len:308 (-),score=29.33 TRINITY_DN54385_c0_g1_i1:122-997(-)
MALNATHHHLHAGAAEALPSDHPLHPLVAGVVAGCLHVILGPDHLTTIITLSACQGAQAFWFGLRWAMGHLVGMLFIGLFALIAAAHGGQAVLDAWEHVADYLVGCILIFFGGYFLMYSGVYFDSEWRPRKASCECHVNILGTDAVEKGQHISTESEPLLGKVHSHKRARHTHFGGHGHGKDSLDFMRRCGSSVVGFLQGIACPTGAVGLLFLKKYSGNSLQTCTFVSVFFIVATLAMGLMALTFGVLTKHCVSSGELARAIYCFSCGASLALGVMWIALAWSGRLWLIAD